MINKKVFLFIIFVYSILFCSCGPNININIEYPIEDTWWEKNTSYPIRFNTSADIVDIKLYKGNNPITDIKSSFEVNPDLDTISINFTPSDTLEDGDDYKIVISNAPEEGTITSESGNIHIVSDLDPTSVQLTWNFEDEETESYGFYMIKSGIANLLDNGNGTYTVNGWGEPGENDAYTIQPTETGGIQYEDVIVIDNEGEGIKPAFYDLFFLGDDDFFDENIYAFTVYKEHLNINFTQPGMYKITYNGTEYLNIIAPEPPVKNEY